MKPSMHLQTLCAFEVCWSYKINDASCIKFILHQCTVAENLHIPSGVLQILDNLSLTFEKHHFIYWTVV